MVPECSDGDHDRDKWLCVDRLAGVTETTNTCSNSYQGLRMCRPYQPDRLNKEALGLRRRALSSPAKQHQCWTIVSSSPSLDTVCLLLWLNL